MSIGLYYLQIIGIKFIPIFKYKNNMIIHISVLIETKYLHTKYLVCFMDCLKWLIKKGYDFFHDILIAFSCDLGNLT